MSEEFITAEEAAKILKVNIMTIYRYIKVGKLRAYKIGRVFRIKRRDFEEFLEKHKAKVENQ